MRTALRTMVLAAGVSLGLALPSPLATDDVPSVTTVGQIQIELTTLERTFTAPTGYRATLRVTGRSD